LRPLMEAWGFREGPTIIPEAAMSLAGYRKLDLGAATKRYALDENPTLRAEGIPVSGCGSLCRIRGTGVSSGTRTERLPNDLRAFSCALKNVSTHRG